MAKIKLSDLTLREKIGQTLMIRDGFFAGVENKEEYLKRNPVGGVWSFGRPLKRDVEAADFNVADGEYDPASAETAAKLPLEMSKYLKVPPVIAADTVSGYCDLTSVKMSNMAVGATGEVDMARQIAATLADEFKCAGVRWIWQPVADLFHRESAAMIGRTYTDDPDMLVKMCNAAIDGYQSHGVAAGMKHFPGGGLNSKRDTHINPECNDMTLEEWEAGPGRVYQEVINSGVYTVMTSHSSFPAVDDTKIGKQYVPSTFSKKVTTDLLKVKMGFDGVVITDDLFMRAGKTLFPNIEDLYIAALNAGNDVLLGAEMPPDYVNYIDVIEKAVEDGVVSIERIDDACERVLRLKERLGLFDEGVYSEKFDAKSAVENTARVHREVSDKAVTLVANDIGLIPLDKEKVKKVAVVAFAHIDAFYKAARKLADILRARGIEVTVYEKFSLATSKQIAEECDLIIYAMYLGPHAPFGASSFFGEVMQSFFNVMCFGREKSIPVSFGSPNIYYDYFEGADTFINAYTYSDTMLESFVRAIFGEIDFKGISPFRLIP